MTAKINVINLAKVKTKDIVKSNEFSKISKSLCNHEIFMAKRSVWSNVLFFILYVGKYLFSIFFIWKKYRIISINIKLQLDESLKNFVVMTLEMAFTTLQIYFLN